MSATIGINLLAADACLRRLFPKASLAEVLVGERDEFVLRIVHPIPFDQLDAFVIALKGLIPMPTKTTKSAPKNAKAPAKSPAPKGKAKEAPAKKAARGK